MPTRTILAAARVLVAAIGLASLPALAASNPVLGYDDARHLLARTGFGPTDAEVRAYATLTRGDAVAKLLRETRTTAVTPPPASAIDTSPLRPPRGENVPEAERKAFVQQQIREGLEANLTLVSLDEEWVVRKEGFFSKSKNSCFIGRRLVGRVRYTICNGKIYSFDKQIPQAILVA